MTTPFGASSPRRLDRAVIAATGLLPDSWLGLRLAIALRRIVTMRMQGDDGFDVQRWGLRIRLHPRRNGCEKNLLFTPQMYEVRERVELVAEIDKAKSKGRPFVFVDIGANVGLFSLFVSSHVGADARILAIEPEPENLRRLRYNVAANPSAPIQVIALALGASRGQVVVELDARDRGGTRTRPMRPKEPGDVVSMPCQPLFDVVQQEGVGYIDALKIDVEGAEDQILAPFFVVAPETLWPTFLIIEDARLLWRTDLFSMLAERGYKVSARTRLNVMMRRLAETG